MDGLNASARRHCSISAATNIAGGRLRCEAFHKFFWSGFVEATPKWLATPLCDLPIYPHYCLRLGNVKSFKNLSEVLRVALIRQIKFYSPAPLKNGIRWQSCGVGQESKPLKTAPLPGISRE